MGLDFTSKTPAMPREPSDAPPYFDVKDLARRVYRHSWDLDDAIAYLKAADHDLTPAEVEERLQKLIDHRAKVFGHALMVILAHIATGGKL